MCVVLRKIQACSERHPIYTSPISAQFSSDTHFELRPPPGGSPGISSRANKCMMYGSTAASGGSAASNTSVERDELSCNTVVVVKHGTTKML